MSQTYVHGIAADSINRHANDYYATSPEATRALLSVEDFIGGIWEPACGEGAISEVLIAHGHQVWSTDLYDYGYGVPGVDFLSGIKALHKRPNIITNPPYKHAEEFVRLALRRTTGKVAMLCRLAWLEGIERNKLFTTSPLKSVWVFSNRIPMKRGNDSKYDNASSMLCFAWFVFDHSHTGSPSLGWLISDRAGRPPRLKKDSR